MKINDLYYDNLGQIGQKWFDFQVSIAKKTIEKKSEHNRKKRTSNFEQKIRISIKQISPELSKLISKCPGGHFD